jgi:hypothetical protein
MVAVDSFFRMRLSDYPVVREKTLKIVEIVRTEHASRDFRALPACRQRIL